MENWYIPDDVASNPEFVSHNNDNEAQQRFWEKQEVDNLFISYLRMINLLKPTGHVMYQQINIKQLYALPTLYLCVLNLSENKQRLVPLTA